MAAGKEKNIDLHESLFGVDAWLSTSDQYTVYPGAPWLQIQETLCQRFASIVDSEINLSPERNQAVISCVGPQFTLRFLSYFSPQLGLNECPKPALMEIKLLLSEGMTSAVSEAGYESLITHETSRENPHQILQQFRKETALEFKDYLQRFYKNEEARLMFQQLKVDLSLPKQRTDHYFNKIVEEENVKLTDVIKPGPKVKVCSKDSEIIGKMVASVLERYPEKISMVIGKLKGFHLPATLRKHIWTEVIFQCGHNSDNPLSGNMKNRFRHEFGKRLESNLKKLHVKFPLKSPIKDLIENTVIETYNKTPSMKLYRSAAYMKETIRILNALYIYNQSYQPFFVLWLFPLQIAVADFVDNGRTEGEEIYELAMLLHLLESKCFPSWAIMSVIAENVMATLEKKDPELHKHLYHVATINTQVNPKECLVYLMEEERSIAERMVESKRSNRTKRTVAKRQPMTSLSLAQPIMFIRQWIGEAFVGKLDVGAMLWVWDQLFLNFWQQQIFQDVCLALVTLLREDFLRASDYLEMKQVFVSQTFHLLTLDIQRSYLAVAGGTNLHHIETLNRSSPQGVSESDIAGSAAGREVKLVPNTLTNPTTLANKIQGLDLKSTFQPSSPSNNSKNLPQKKSTIQVSDVSFKLDFQQFLLQEETDKNFPWKESPETNKILVKILFRFGDDCIAMKEVQPSMMTFQKTPTISGKLVYIAKVTDIVSFTLLNLPSYLDKMISGEYFHLIVMVDYVRNNDNLGLGWAFIPLTELSQLKDQPLHRNRVAALHPGVVPDIFTQHARESLNSKEMSSKYILGYNSELFLTIEVRSEVVLKTSKLKNPQIAGIDDTVLWLEHQADMLEEDKMELSHEDRGLCIYVDGLRMLPDNASIIKVVPYLVQSSNSLTMRLVPTYPAIKSKARCPVFAPADRYIIQKIESLAADTFLLFTVYTIDTNSGQLCTLGNALMLLNKTYTDDDDVKFCSGGYQLRLRSGSLDMTTNIKSSCLDNLPIVPVVSLLIRILPFTQDPEKAPTYTSRYYHSNQCRPTISEERIFGSFQKHSKLSETFRKTIHKLQLSEDIQTDQTESRMVEWCKIKLFTEIVVNPLPVLNINQFISYKLDIGLKVSIEKAFNLKEKDLYVQCVTYVISDGVTAPMSEHVNTNKYFITLKQDVSCPLHYPVWQDPPTVIHPLYDNNTCLLIQMIGLKIISPGFQESQPLNLKDFKGIQLGPAKFVCWTAVNIFEGDSLRSGHHYLPLISGQPSEETLQQLSNMSAHSVFREIQPQCCYGTASLFLSIWDGHFEFEELPKIMSYKEMLNTVGDIEDYEKRDFKGTQLNERRDTLSDIIGNNCDGNSSSFLQNLNDFEEIVTKKLEHLMTSSSL